MESVGVCQDSEIQQHVSLARGSQGNGAHTEQDHPYGEVNVYDALGKRG
jgi:hypothetical protein